MVGCPHLVSLKGNYERLVTDTLSMAGKEETSRFFEISLHRQFVPCRLGSKGSADKDGYYLDGSPKKRPTNEGGTEEGDEGHERDAGHADQRSNGRPCVTSGVVDFCEVGA